MAVKKIYIWPDKRLTQETRAVVEIDDQVRTLCRDLIDTMRAHDGAGIAAIQIGSPLKVFVIDWVGDPVVFINPEVIWTDDGNWRTQEEGCLSFPGIFVSIARQCHVQLKAKGLDGEEFYFEGEGMLARCLLHELDHLTGKLLVDYVSPRRRRAIKGQMILEKVQ